MSCVIVLPPKGADDADPWLVLARNLQYFRANRDRTLDCTSRACGLPIGSGVIEAARRSSLPALPSSMATCHGALRDRQCRRWQRPGEDARGLRSWRRPGSRLALASCVITWVYSEVFLGCTA